MLFCSKEFIFIFLLVFLIVYYLVPNRFKNLTLLLGSLIFYAVGDFRYLPLLVLSVCVNFILGIFIEGSRIQSIEENLDKNVKKTVFLIIALIYDFGLLFVFKYFTFFTGIKTNLALPLGISFYTFQIASYIIDVYKGTIKVEKNIINLGTYLCMFPKLIQGPIATYSDMGRQMSKRKYSFDKFQDGIRLFVVGLGFKMIIANILGMCWNSIKMYGIESISTPMAWIAMFAYTFQIYFDFCGYSVMAMGIGKMLGFEIPRNFDCPYESRSVTEFWRRWHITLGMWFRNYIYIPLGGNRKGILRTIFNMFLVWALTGLWHGASWNFVLWGILFFVLLTIEKLGFKKVLDKHKIFSHIYMILIIPMSWVIFALDKMEDIKIFFIKLFPFISGEYSQFINKTDYLPAISRYWIFFVLAVIFSLSTPRKLFYKYKTSIIVTILLIVVFVLSVYRIMTSASNPFLYFRF